MQEDFYCEIQVGIVLTFYSSVGTPSKLAPSQLGQPQLQVNVFKVIVLLLRAPDTSSLLGQPQPHDNIFKVIVLLLRAHHTSSHLGQPQPHNTPSYFSQWQKHRAVQKNGIYFAIHKNFFMELYSPRKIFVMKSRVFIGIVFTFCRRHGDQRPGSQETFWTRKEKEKD